MAGKNCGICRVIKHKSKGGITTSANHNWRISDTPNADSDRTHLNVSLLCQSPDELHAALDARLATVKTIRKNAVLLLEYMVTFSGDSAIRGDAQRMKKYFADSVRSIQKRHGKENVISITSHSDEKTPHLCLYVVPIDPKGALNARYFTGGYYKTQAIQDEHYAEASKDAGLARGDRGGKATHKKIAAFYAELKSQEDYDKAIGGLDVLTLDVNKRVDELLVRQEAIDAVEKDLAKRESAVLREIPLERVFEALGGTAEGYSPNRWSISGVSYDIDPEHRRNFRCSEAKKPGKGAIDAVMQVCACKYDEAIFWLKTRFSPEQTMSEAIARTRENVEKIMLSEKIELIQIQAHQKESRIIKNITRNEFNLS